jgi:hypothetical protein
MPYGRAGTENNKLDKKGQQILWNNTKRRD